MVIEMANGTKITIGPNDVRNISFNNGELVMTGEDINSLVEQQNELKARMEAIDFLMNEIQQLGARTESLVVITEDHDMWITHLMNILDEMMSRFPSLEERLKTLEYEVFYNLQNK